jgi:hypothetical protein
MGTVPGPPSNPRRDKAYQDPGMRQKHWFLLFPKTVPHLGSMCIGARTMQVFRVKLLVTIISSEERASGGKCRDFTC